jgi:hypothetical protein
MYKRSLYVSEHVSRIELERGGVVRTDPFLGDGIVFDVFFSHVNNDCIIAYTYSEKRVNESLHVFFPTRSQPFKKKIFFGGFNVSLSRDKKKEEKNPSLAVIKCEAIL